MFLWSLPIESQVKKLLRSHFYPENKFSARQFPNLEKRLLKHFKLCAKRGKSPVKEGLEHYLNQHLSISALLKKYPSVLIELYSSLIWQVIRKHCFNSDDWADLYQQIVVELLERRLGYMQKTYDPKEAFTPYFSMVVINCCLDIQRKMAAENYPLTESLLENYSESDAETEFDDFDETPCNEEVFSIEYERLSLILTRLKNPKLIFTFKVIYSVPIDKSEIKKGLPLISPWDVKTYFKRIQGPKFKRLDILTELFNKYERKKTKPDSLRRLLDLYLNEIAEQMNRYHHEDIYTKKSLRLLLKKYYESERKTLSLNTDLTL